MFPLQRTDELVFGTPTISQGNEILADPIEDHASLESNIIDFSSIRSSHKQLGQKTRFGFRQRHTESSKDYNNIRVLHRDSERKRREEISKLYISLQSLLPPDQTKGKRSICDQVGEALNYIKYMQNKIQDLRIRRDKLKKSGTEVVNSCCDNLPNSVVVILVQERLEILITTSSELELSKVMAKLLEREFDVLSCLSTKAQGVFLHKILAKTCGDLTSFDLSVIQERLIKAIN